MPHGIRGSVQALHTLCIRQAVPPRANVPPRRAGTSLGSGPGAPEKFLLGSRTRPQADREE